MAQFDFYGSWRDTIIILEQIIKTGKFILIADSAYREPSVYEIHSISDKNLEKIRWNHSVFLWSNLYLKTSVKFSPPNSKGDMDIDQLKSSPSIDMMLPDVYEEEGMYRLGGGFIHYPPFFIDPDTNAGYHPPKELYITFKSLKTIIQALIVKTYYRYEKNINVGEFKPAIDIYWIGQDAFELMQKEKGFIQRGSIHITRADLFLSRDEIKL